MNPEIIVIGSGIGGLTAGALLARYGKKVLICESHTIAGGAAHSFSRQGFCFDSGRLLLWFRNSPSRNPLKQVLDLIEEKLDVVAYDPLGYYHFPEQTIPIYCNLVQYRNEVAKITLQGAKELEKFHQCLLALYNCLKDISIITLRADWQVFLNLFLENFPALTKALFQLNLINASVGQVMDRHITDPLVHRLIDVECFLLSGLKAHGTIAPEVAFMLGERNDAKVEYPIGGSGAIVEAIIRGFKRWGGELRLGTHVDKILVKAGQVRGIQLRNGEIINAPIVISNATIWDTYNQLLSPEDLPFTYRKQALETPTIDSFMHLHLGIKGDGLEGLAGHHVVIHDENQDITEPGNTCMISIPSIWDKTLAPEGHYVIHAYTLESYQGWQKNQEYGQKKQLKAQSLYQAIEKIIPDLRQRIVLELIGTPLTHARFLRRYQGTYGAAIASGKGTFPSCHTPIAGLYRVGDSTLPGIGVPAVAASGIFCANTLVSPQTVRQVVD